MKLIGKLMLVLAILMLGCWAWVDQGRPFWIRAMALERSGWPAALGNKALRGVPLYVRCSLNQTCQRTLIKFEASHALPASRPWGYLPAALLAISGLGLIAPRPQRRLYTGAWATSAQYQRLLTPYPSNDGASILLAGQSRHQRQFLAVRGGLAGRREIGHILVVGPSRSGKSLMLIANLLNWRSSVIVLDVKGELHQHTSGYRSTIGRVVVLNPSGIGDQFDPFPYLVGTPEDMAATASRMMGVDGETEKIFSERATSGVVAILRGAQLQGVPTLQFMAQQVRGQGMAEFIASMMTIKDSQISAALAIFLGVKPDKLSQADLTDRFLVSSWGTMVTRLGPYLTDGVVALTNGNSFQVEALANETRPLTVYLQFNERSLPMTRGVFGLIVSGLMHGLMDQVDVRQAEDKQAKRPVRPPVPVLLAIDEGGAVPMPNLPDLMALVSSRGVSVLLIVQSLSQLVAAYGREGSSTIKSNAHHSVYYPPRSLETAEEISKLSGRASMDDERISEQVGIVGNGRQSRTRGERDRPLITVDEARQLPPQTVLVISDELPIIKASRIEHWRVPEMTSLLEREPTPIHPQTLSQKASAVTVEAPVATVQKQISKAQVAYVDID